MADPLLRFWFRFVFPNTSAICHMGPTRAYRDLLRPHLDSYFGQCFERLCREALPWLYEKEGVTAPFERSLLVQDHPDRPRRPAGRRLDRPRRVQMGAGPLR